MIGHQGRFLRKLPVLALLACVLSATPAFAGIGLSIVGAGDYDLYNQSAGGATVKGTVGYGGGALLEFGLAPRFALEVGAIYLQREIQTTFAGATVTAGVDSIYCPASLFLGLAPGFGLLAGGYYDHYTASGASADDGFQGGVRFRSRAFFVDARYSQSAKDSADHDALLLIGFTFGRTR